MKVKSISFGSLAFRMFKDMTIELADRVTIIAGHNAMGKSTILGLIANGSELKKQGGVALTNKLFQAKFSELFYIDEKKEYIKARGKKPTFTINYCKNDCSDLIKTCNVTVNSAAEEKHNRMRIIPRGTQIGWDCSNDGKVPIPTLYLGMGRVTPIGENQREAKVLEAISIESVDKTYISKHYKEIISSNTIDGGKTYHQSIPGTTKSSLLPELTYSTKSISLGQDTLSAIITAFASFNRLKRVNTEYVGGLLLIDEVDAGFHPSVQRKLIKFIKTEARKLNLQVIVTTHSLTIIKEIFAEQNKQNKHIDNVVYIMNRLNPTLMNEPTYQKIKHDMITVQHSETSKIKDIKVFFEDEEARFVFERIAEASGYSNKDYYKRMELVGIKAGCETLLTLSNIDSLYNVIFICDQDIISQEKYKKAMEKNVRLIMLPYLDEKECLIFETMNPEATIANYLNQLTQNQEHGIWSVTQELHSGYISDTVIEPLKKEIDEPNAKKNREVYKDWFNRQTSLFNQLNVFKFYVCDNEKEVSKFFDKMSNAVNKIIG